MPRKDFEAFSRLDASDVNTYLMDQAVQTFASSAARGSAIAAPTEGMVTWLNDANSLEVYDGTAWNGLAASGGNAIINGAFEINQRSFTSSTTSLTYGFDRWQLTTADGTGTYSSQSFTAGELSVPSYGQPSKYARIVTTGQTLTSARTLLAQGIEKVETFAGETVTASFWAKAATGTPKIAVELFQSFGTTGSAAVSTPAGQVTLSTSWTRYSVTVAVPSVSGKTISGEADRLSLLLWASAGADFNARTGSLGIQSNTFDIWGVQLEAGPTANAFRRNANSLQGELAACQRYYFRTTSELSAYANFSYGIANSTTACRISVTPPTEMRIKPNSVEFANLSLFDGAAFFAVTGTTIDTGINTPRLPYVNCGVASGLTQFRPYFLIANNTTSAFLAFSAEL
jgi:hypothetical protein